MLINTFHGKQEHTFTKIYKLYNRITTKKFSSAAADSRWCGAVNAVPVVVVKNVEDRRKPPVETAPEYKE